MSAKRHSPWAACYSAFNRTWMLRAIVEKKYRHHFIDVRAHYLGKTAKKLHFGYENVVVCTSLCKSVINS